MLTVNPPLTHAGITSLLGTVAHECSLTPVLSSPSAAAAYARIMRERHRKAAEPRRTLKRLEVDDATANRLASGVGVGGIKARAATFAVSFTSCPCSRKTPLFPREADKRDVCHSEHDQQAR